MSRRDDDAGDSGPASPTAEVDWKLLFHQLFALEIKKEHVLGDRDQRGAESLDRLLQAYSHYTPSTFNDALDRLSEVETSDEAYEARRAFFEDPHHRRLISDLDLRRCVGERLRAAEAVGAFLDVVWRNKDRPISEGESFFESPEGKAVVRALAVDGGADDQEVALVLLPGYAGHTIKYQLFEEMVVDANLSHGRPAERALEREEGIDIEFESHRDYYGRGDAGEGPFDILQPGGKELGNTTGVYAETADLLYDWIRSLPEAYSRKKLILLGYSKGASIVLDLVRRHPDLSPRVLGYVSFCGVLQGTQVARLALEQAETILRDVPIAELIEKIREEEPARIGRVLSPLFADVDLSWLAVPRIRAVFDVLGYDVTPLEQQVDSLLGSREVREILEGARELSPLERSRWNLKHLNDETFRDPAHFFQISTLTDVQDFVRPVGLRADDPGARSLLAPVLTEEGTLDWKHLSLDALFLYVTSIDGFKSAPGGLFDTQVELANTKAPMLDGRPLSESLTEEDLAELWEDEELAELWDRCGIESPEELGRVPRRALFPEGEQRSLDAIDLGELKGHHWVPFVQALRPPPELSTEHARWDFPRKAFMRALLQLLAFYNVVRHVDETGDGAKKVSDDALAEVEDDFRDVVFFRSEGVGPARRQLLNLYNLGARAATFGIVTSGARTGLGTSTVTGRALRTESLYYQGLRLYSAADAEFRRGLLHGESSWPLPRSLALIVARLPGRFVDSYPEEPLERLAEIHRALKVVAPGLKPFELRQLAPGDYVVRPRSRKVSFATPIRESLWQGTRPRLAEMERDAYPSEREVGLEDKLKAMLGAFTPFCTVFSAAFDRDEPEKGSTRLTVYLPPYHTLHADDLDDPASWYLEKGLGSYELPRPVRLAAAELTHVRYLHEADPTKAQAVRLEVYRDFRADGPVTTVASFGRLFDGSADELFGFDEADHRDALHVVFRPRFAPADGDTQADRRFKDTFNRVFGPFEVEARVHTLALQLRHKGVGDEPIHDDSVLRPSFVLDDSSITFRVHRYVDTTVEHLPLQAAGFTCRETVGGEQRFHCWRDFWTWDQLRDEFFYGRTAGSDRLSLPTHLRGRLLEQLVGTAAKAVVDRAIEEIEDAVDDEVARITDNFLKRYTKARTVLLDRLHDGLLR